MIKKIEMVEVILGQDVTIEEGAIVGYKVSDDPVVLGDNSYIHAGAIIYSGCRIGAHSHVYHNTVLLRNTVIGKNTKIGALCVTQGHVKIGDWVTIASHCHLTSDMEIEDGAFLSVGIYTGNALYPGGRLHREEMKAITPPKIERGARIGAGVVINPGVVIGQEALIGSGATVTKSIPPFMIAVGSPAKVIGEVPASDRIDWSSLR